jgi:hypothetical protein
METLRYMEQHMPMLKKAVRAQIFMLRRLVKKDFVYVEDGESIVK